VSLIALLNAKPEAGWTTSAEASRGTVDGVDFTCGARWWGSRWSVTGDSAFAVPETMILFASQRGMDHGFWRDLVVGEPKFDARFFVFCDTPALLPLVLGARTRAALANGDIELYVRDRRVKTTGRHQKSDETALDRHLAIHRALADDHRACLSAWQQRMHDAHGRADPTWPPTATLLRPSGALLVNLSWTAPTTRDAHDWDDAAMSLRTEVTAHDDRARTQWSLRAVSSTTACTHILAGRRFVLLGKLPIALAVLDGIVASAGISSIAVHANRITVGLRGIANARQIEGAVRIIELVVEATRESSSPYR
jgi:hypothetical protein